MNIAQRAFGGALDTSRDGGRRKNMSRLCGDAHLTLALAMTIALGNGIARGDDLPVSVAHLPPPTAEDGYFEIAETVRPGVLLIRQAEPFHVWPSSNIIVFEQSEALVVVDSGNAPLAAERVLPLIKSFSTKPVRAIVLTHGHYDHLYGLQTFLREWPDAEVVATQATHDYVEGRYGYYLNYGAEAEVQQQGEWIDRARRMLEAVRAGGEEAWLLNGMMQNAREYYQYGRDRVGTRRILPTRTFTDRLLLDDPTAPIEVRFIGRANTHGDAVIWSPTHRVVAAGDMVVSPVPYGSGIYAADMIQTLENLKAIPFEVLIPGHGLPQSDRLYLSQLQASIRDVQTYVQSRAGEGVDFEAMRAGYDTTEQRRTFGVHDDPWLTYWFDRYWIGSMMRAVYDEANGVRNRYESDDRPSAQSSASSAQR